MGEDKNAQQDNCDHTGIKGYQNVTPERGRGERKGQQCEEVTDNRDIPENGKCFPLYVKKALNPIVFDIIEEFFEMQDTRRRF